MSQTTTVRDRLRCTLHRVIVRDGIKGRAIVFVLMPLAAGAATITVNTNADNTNSGDAHCTLREAIANVNAGTETTGSDCIAGTASGDTIAFAAPYMIRLAQGELAIQQNLTISGPSGGLRISGTHQTRVFEIAAGTTSMYGVTIQLWKADHGGGVLVDSGATLNLTSCTLSGNMATVAGGGLYNDGGTVSLADCIVKGTQARPGNGGGVYNNGSATLGDSTFAANLANPGNGGGIDNEGTVTLTHSTFHRNHTRGGVGGAISSSGKAMLSNTTVNANRAGLSGGGVEIATGGTATLAGCTISANSSGTFGGGIDNEGTATLTNCTINGNFARGDIVGEGGGGGIINSDTATSLSLNCSITGNRARRDGGGIFNFGTATVLTLTNCTISGNHAGARHQTGGGIDGYATFRNTIVAHNTAEFGANCAGTGIDQGHNLSDGTCGFSGPDCEFGPGSSFCNVNPQLDPAGLKDNGGPTQTVALCTGPGVPSASCTAASSAIDAGDDAVTGPPDNLTTDQRGLPRLSGARVDIGAYEVQ